MMSRTAVHWLKMRGRLPRARSSGSSWASTWNLPLFRTWGTCCRSSGWARVRLGIQSLQLLMQSACSRDTHDSRRWILVLPDRNIRTPLLVLLSVVQTLQQPWWQYTGDAARAFLHHAAHALFATSELGPWEASGCALGGHRSASGARMSICASIDRRQPSI